MEEEQQLANKLELVKTKYEINNFITYGSRGALCRTLVKQYLVKLQGKQSNPALEKIKETGYNPEGIIQLLKSDGFKEAQEKILGYQDQLEKAKEGLKTAKGKQKEELEEAIKDLEDSLSKLNTQALLDNKEALLVLLEKNSNIEINEEEEQKEIELVEKILENFFYSVGKTDEEVKRFMGKWVQKDFEAIFYGIITEEDNGFKEASKDFFIHTLS